METLRQQLSDLISNKLWDSAELVVRETPLAAPPAERPACQILRRVVVVDTPWMLLTAVARCFQGTFALSATGPGALSTPDRAETLVRPPSPKSP